MDRPANVNEMLGYAPGPLRAYVEALEARIEELERLEREREDPGGQQRIADASANHLGGFASESDTSRKAALDNYPRSGTQRLRVLEEVIRRAETGVTSEEIAERLSMHLPSVKPRLTELREGGFVEKVDARPGAMGSDVDVYKPTDKGRLESRERSETR